MLRPMTGGPLNNLEPSTPRPFHMTDQTCARSEPSYANNCSPWVLFSSNKRIFNVVQLYRSNFHRTSMLPILKLFELITLYSFPINGEITTFDTLFLSYPDPGIHPIQCTPFPFNEALKTAYFAIMRRPLRNMSEICKLTSARIDFYRQH